jgi:hypothetical protein
MSVVIKQLARYRRLVQILFRADCSFAGVCATRFSYPQLQNDLANHATSAADATAVRNLPSSDPTQGVRFFIVSAIEKTWGLLPAFAPLADQWGTGVTAN